jgi:hypothetical protein
MNSGLKIFFHKQLQIVVELPVLLLPAQGDKIRTVSAPAGSEF